MNFRFFSVSFWRGLVGIALFLALWEVVARSGFSSGALMPPLATILGTLAEMAANGTAVTNTASTMARLLIGLGLACLFGIPVGALMGRFKLVERLWLPVVSVLMPIPSLAWVPLFILWFGIGNITTIVVVFYAASFPVTYNTWTGVRAVNPLWVRASIAMGASRGVLFRKVVLPGSLPYIITGIRLSFGRAWIAVIGGELLASPEFGLGRLIFDAKEFLNSEIMLASLLVIGLLGLLFERLVFQLIEERTVGRWGMMTTANR